MVTRDERLAAAETLTRLINGYQISRAVYVVTDLSVGEHRGDDGVGPAGSRLFLLNFAERAASLSTSGTKRNRKLCA